MLFRSKINLISNVSVVQESAKRYEDALTTWRRYEAISEKWGENFSKHYRYRLAGLEHLAGQREAAVRDYESAYASATRLQDSFHCQFIAAGLGQLHLESDPNTSGEWFVKALGHAGEMGEPLKLAQSQLGVALAGASTDFGPVLTSLEADSTWPKEVGQLRSVLEVGDVSGIAGSLPRPKSKLNRPFDAVNLT